MKASDFIERVKQIVRSRSRQDLVCEYSYPLTYASGFKYEFLRITSENFHTDFRPKSWLIITAGFHGDEKAGPLTIVERLDEIADIAHSRGIGLIIYPLINPSGFDTNTRYNIDQEKPNNDFLRYILADGRVVDDLKSSKEFESWFPLRDMSRPKETIRLHGCIDYDFKHYEHIAGGIDLHQDGYIKGPFAYRYAFGDLSRYAHIIKKIGEIIAILKNSDVSSGQISPAWSDEYGFVVRHDGSITDYLYLRGVSHALALETTTDTPMELAIEVNMIWIRGLIEIISQNL